MKISDNRKKSAEFKLLKIGQVFLYNNNFFMKTDNSYCEDDKYNNSVCISTGELDYFGDKIAVMPVNAELIIT